MSRNLGKTLKIFAVGSLVAAGIGYIFGLLTAPKSGRQTKADIIDTTDRGKAKAERQLKELLGELGELINEAKKQSDKASSKAQKDVKGLISKGLVTKDKIKDIISAVQKGDADDHDLKRAVKNASESIDHLKDFLKK